MQHLSIKKKTLPNSDDSPSGGAHLSEFPFSEGFDITHRRPAEGAAVFAIEMTDTFVSDLKRPQLRRRAHRAASALALPAAAVGFDTEEGSGTTMPHEICAGSRRNH